VLKDFSIFWREERDHDSKRQFLSLVFEGVWLDERRVVAVQPKPAFLAYFEAQAGSNMAAHPARQGRPTGQGWVQGGSDGSAKSGSDGTRTRDLCRDRAAL
jgi:hypothetical protein